MSSILCVDLDIIGNKSNIGLAMNLDNLPLGDDVPNSINVVVEIPAHGSPVKYEIDKDSGALVVDRFMGTAMFYPCNYGFIPHTLSEDGDPVDLLVVPPVPLISGSVISCRPVGMLEMVDEAGEDHKLLAVPTSSLSITTVQPLVPSLASPFTTSSGNPLEGCRSSISSVVFIG